jgi:ribonuclease BN (tRNA processing enzyme)
MCEVFKMQIKVLGAHNIESLNTRHITLLVDRALAIEAGSLTSELTFEEQDSLSAVLLTHGHYDHIRDIPALAINLFLRQKSVQVFTHTDVYEKITRFFLNGQIYSEFHKTKNESQASLFFTLIQENQTFNIDRYQVTAIPVKHSIPTLGFAIQSTDGGSFFYTGDTGTGLHDVWARISPQILLIEVTAGNRWEASCLSHGHLTPRLLKAELENFRRQKGYLPRIVTVHTNPMEEPRIRSELVEVQDNLGARIEIAYEGMLIDL